MKKIYLLIFFLCILGITMIFYQCSKQELIINKTLREEKDNYYLDIIYPYLGNQAIDSYIEEYLDNNISAFKKKLSSDNLLLIDYDYQTKETYLEVLFYKYQLQDKVVNYKVTQMRVDLSNNKVITTEVKLREDYRYDFYQNKEVSPSKKIAITFDDGPNYNTMKVLNILKKYHAKATFFVLGSKAEDNPNIIKELSASGMEIGNHTYSHKLLANKDEGYIQNEVHKTSDIIYNITKTYPSLVRPSYGSFSKRIRENVGMPIIIWNIDPLDWKYHNSKRVVDNILTKVKEGDIILLHDIHSSTVNAVKTVVPKLIEEGYDLVTVSELFYYYNKQLYPGQVYSKAS